jgi:argininosuccinate synthase
MYEGRWLEPQSLMLRESIQKWVGSAISGTVTLRLRRGDDYTILDTTGSGLSYAAEKLSMERVGDAAFGPTDRIGQLTMRNLDIADSRTRLEHYAGLGLIGGATGDLVGRLEKGEADEITDHVEKTSAEGEELAEAVDEASESASFDFGAD